MPLTRSGPYLGSYGRNAGASLTFEWVPDPIVWSDRILAIEDNLEDRTVPLLLSQEIIKQDIDRNFAGEHDPQGQPWEPWSESYTYEDPVTFRKSSHRGYADRYKQFHSGRILDWTGELREAATSDRAFVQISGETVNNDSLYYDTGALPPYGMWHQEGVEWRTPGGRLPQRRFLGLSDDAQEEILIVFGEWFDEEIELGTRKSGAFYAKPRRASGRATL